MDNYYLSGNDAFRLKFYIPKKQNVETKKEGKEEKAQWQKSEFLIDIIANFLINFIFISL